MFSRLLFKLLISVLLLSRLGCQPADKQPLEELLRRYQELTRHYDRLAESREDLSLRIKLAEFYYNFRDYSKAAELLEGINTPPARAVLAKTYARLKDYDRAIEIFEHLQPPPEDPEYLYLYGEVLQAKNLFPRALQVYGQVKEPFSAKAEERVKLIKSRVEEGVPAEVARALEESEGFLGQIEQEAAVFILVDEEIEVTAKNTSLARVHVIEKVLQERGKELAEVEINYDSTYERVELEFARTITADGRVIYAGRENIRDVSRYLNFPLYSNSRAFIVSMPAVDVGALIEYKINIHSSKLINKKDLSFIYRLREKYPIFKAAFRITTPADKQLHFKFFNSEYAGGINLAPAVSSNGAKMVYSWSFNRIKPVIPEYSMPPDALINPAVLISSFSSWDEIYQWWSSLYRDKVTPDKDIAILAGKVTRGAVSELERAKRIYEYVAENIRYVAIEYGDSGYEPHSAREVLLNRYGDCKDQAILLVTLLRAAGFRAHPVLIPTRRVYPISEEFPSLNFNHAICALEWEGKLIFMDPTAETVPFMSLPLSDQERTVLVFLEDRWQITDTGSVGDNIISYHMDIAISQQEEAVIRRKVASSGFFAAGYRWYLKYTHPALIEEDIREKMTEISPSARLLGYKIQNADSLDADPVLEYGFSTPEYLNPAGDLRVLPVLDQLHLDYSLIGKQTRDYPIDFDGIYTKQATVKITLPDNLRVKYLPAFKVLENPWFRLKVTYENTGRTINFYQEFNILKRIVGTDEYQKFKGSFREASHLLREEIILEEVQ